MFSSAHYAKLLVFFEIFVASDEDLRKDFSFFACRSSYLHSQIPPSVVATEHVKGRVGLQTRKIGLRGFFSPSIW